jgi:hypothetical protein
MRNKFSSFFLDAVPIYAGLGAPSTVRVSLYLT